MEESVADLLSRITFTGRPVETIYLNKDRVREHFIGQVGAIESFTKTASRTGSIEAPVVKVGGGISSDRSVTWSLTDPVTQALVLRAALGERGLLKRINEAEVGSYITFSGATALVRPGMDRWQVQRKMLSAYPGLHESLEAEREGRQDLAHMLGQPDQVIWSLAMTDGTSFCAAFLDQNLLYYGAAHWIMNRYHAFAEDNEVIKNATNLLPFYPNLEIFALVREFHPTGIPMLATLHLTVNL
jgi:hypothetical protein